MEAIKVLNMTKLYGKPIRVNKASQDKKSLDVGANLFVGNPDPDADEELLYDTFSAFGVIVTNPKIMGDPETGNSRGFGFISYDSFETSDAAIEVSVIWKRLCSILKGKKELFKISALPPVLKGILVGLEIWSRHSFGQLGCLQVFFFAILIIIGVRDC